MAAATTAGIVDGASEQEPNYLSEQYNSAQPELAVPALPPSTSTPALPEQSRETPEDNTLSPPTAFQSNPEPSAAVAPTDMDDHTQSRPMSQESSDLDIVTDQKAPDAFSSAVPVPNGVSSSTFTSSSDVPVPVDSSNDVSLNTADVQRNDVSKTTASPFPEAAAETPDGTQGFDASAAVEPVKPLANGHEGTSTPAVTGPVAPKPRLPHDKIGMLEDRIKDDPRGDTEAWLALIDEHKKRGKQDDARGAYERFLNLFPAAAEIWLAYAQMENEANIKNALDSVLGKSLMQVPYLPLWQMYLDHVRRHNNVTTDTTGSARQTIHQAYELALRQVGLDKDSGRLWQDYVQFIKSGPGIIGGSNWQDQQKMDLLRKTYQQAICVPTQATNTLWKEYDGFEMGLNKMTGRKFLQDQSPSYMSARASYTELQNITRNLKRTTLPSLPPALGFEGDAEYTEQLNTWKRWIQWEKDDPLVLKAEDADAYKARVLFVYKHALMAMRYWAELWYDASEFCFAHGMEQQGNDFLVQGLNANPESCLLAFKRADRLEQSTSGEEGDEKTTRRAAIVREPYDKVLDALYGLIAKSKVREEQDISRMEAEFAASNDTQPNGASSHAKDEEDEETQRENMKAKEVQKAAAVEGAKSMHAVQMRLLSRTLSYVWIALMRSLRRIQGKGGVNVGGARGVFSDARKRGRITSDVYVQAALIEFHCYEPETGKKIFERGLKLFQEDEAFALEFIKHLVANNDHTNARVVFETVVTRLSQKPETVQKAKPLYVFFHEFESRYGELTQIMKLEKRMSDLFPEDPSLALFSKRFVDSTFDPTAIRPIISPAKQTKAKSAPTIDPSILAAQNATLQAVNQSTASPKRPLPLDDSEPEVDRPRKLVRTDSPMKPSSIPQLPQQPVQQNGQQPSQQQQHPTPLPYNRAPMPQSYLPPPLPRDVTMLLSMIPKAETYHATKFEPSQLVRLIRETNIPTNISQLPQQGAGRGMPMPGPAPQPQQHGPPPHMQGPPQPYPLHGSVPPMQQRPGMPPMPQMTPMIYPAYNPLPNAHHAYAR